MLEICSEVGYCYQLKPSCTFRAMEYAIETERYLFRLTKASNTSYDASEESLRGMLYDDSQSELSLATLGRALDDILIRIDRYELQPTRLTTFCV